MSKYFNSIIACNRGRHWALRSFLRSFYLASSSYDKELFELVITDMDPSNDYLIDKYRDKINIKHCKVDYSDLFWKTKALNHCVSHSEGRYITMLDIESIVTKHFLPNISNFYSNESMERVKMCHRIRMVGPYITRDILLSNFNEDKVNDLVKRHASFRINLERYTCQEFVYRGGEIPVAWLNGDALGPSQMTVLKSIYMDIGGYDERFKGYGCEDLDFNTRLYRFLGGGYLNTDPKFSVYHLTNTSVRQNWHGENAVVHNYNAYRHNKDNNIICVPIGPDWGVF